MMSLLSKLIFTLPVKNMVCACIQISVVSNGNSEQIYYAVLKVFSLYFDKQCITLHGSFENFENIVWFKSTKYLF